VPAFGRHSAGTDRQRPALRENNHWVYQHTRENRTGWHQLRAEITVTRVASSSVSISVKAVGSTMPPSEQLTNPDWSRSRNVNGKMITVSQPLAFPLSVGKAWQIDYVEQNPNRQHSSEHFHYPYKVLGWEDVTVPAGTFHALKIESEGEWSAVVAPSEAAASGTRVDAQGSTTVVQTARGQTMPITGHTYRVAYLALISQSDIRAERLIPMDRLFDLIYREIGCPFHGMFQD
jgi:hypothetical protein